jgi:glycyl-tRNA synthetase beta chain
MPELLLELFSEEIPARMQAQAGRDLERMAREHLAKAGLTPESLTAYAGPRRLTLVAKGLPASTPDREEELKGPRANASLPSATASSSPPSRPPAAPRRRLWPRWSR